MIHFINFYVAFDIIKLKFTYLQLNTCLDLKVISSPKQRRAVQKVNEKWHLCHLNGIFFNYLIPNYLLEDFKSKHICLE